MGLWLQSSCYVKVKTQWDVGGTMALGYRIVWLRQKGWILKFRDTMCSIRQQRKPKSQQGRLLSLEEDMNLLPPFHPAADIQVSSLHMSMGRWMGLCSAGCYKSRLLEGPNLKMWWKKWYSPFLLLTYGNSGWIWIIIWVSFLILCIIFHRGYFLKLIWYAYCRCLYSQFVFLKWFCYMLR